MLSVKNILLALAATMLFVVTLIFKPMWLVHAFGLLLLLASISSFYHPRRFFTTLKEGNPAQLSVQNPPMCENDRIKQQLQQALNLKYGLSVERDIKLSFALLTELAGEDNPEACYELAHCHQHGIGTAANALRAIHWYHAYTRLSPFPAPQSRRPSAKKQIQTMVQQLEDSLAFASTEPKNTVNTLCNLGLYYRWYAPDLAENSNCGFKEKTFDCLKQAAEDNRYFAPDHCEYYYDALYELGCCYIRGHGTAVNYLEAKNCFECLYRTHDRHSAFYPLVTSLLHLRQSVTHLTADFIKGYTENIPQLISAYEDATLLNLCSLIPEVEAAKNTHPYTQKQTYWSFVAPDDSMDPLIHDAMKQQCTFETPLKATHLTSPQKSDTERSIANAPLTPVKMRAFTENIETTKPVPSGETPNNLTRN